MYYEIKNVLMQISHAGINIDGDQKVLDDECVNVVHHIHGLQIFYETNSVLPVPLNMDYIQVMTTFFLLVLVINDIHYERMVNV